MTKSDKPRFDLPTIEAETEPFWAATRRGELLLARCTACSKLHYYPRAHCIHCWSDQLDWVRASGRGTVYSYSTVYVNDLPPFNERLPYIAAMVDLEEGVRITTNLVDCPAESLSVGMPVSIRFHPISKDVVLPLFGPLTETTSEVSK